jgi:CreA protein
MRRILNDTDQKVRRICKNAAQPARTSLCFTAWAPVHNQPPAYIQPRELAMKTLITSLLLSSLALAANAETVGSVSTTFKLLSPNDKVVVDVFDDPAVDGVACYLSHAKTGGYAGALGLAEDTSDAAVACRQVGPITFKEKIDKQDEVFNARSSFLFKHVRVVRMVDVKRNTLVYLVYSDKIIDGSPKNSVTAVAVPAAQPIPVK